MKTIINTLYTTFFVLLTVIAGLFLATLLPIPGNIEVKIVESGSMEPAIHTGSIVVIKAQSAYQVGDVVTFGADTKEHVPTTHRIVALQPDPATGQLSMTTKGDANEENDPETSLVSSVIGKVIITVPYVGFMIDLARKPVGFVLLIGIPAAIIIIDEASKIVIEVLRIRREKRTPARPLSGVGAIDAQSHPLTTSSGPRVMDLRDKKDV